MTASLEQYERTAYAGSLRLMRQYSTSFGLASRLLESAMERDIAAIYGMVRVADEIVDGTAAAAGLSRERCGEVLGAYEKNVAEAVAEGFSTDLVLHAFAATARRHRIGEDLFGAFFASMRMDLGVVAFTSEAELSAYVYGSAEVIGLMCFKVFTSGTALSPENRELGERGARALGSALQRLNFLRDLAFDSGCLGRRYLPAQGDSFTERDKTAALERVADDLASARASLPVLPYRPRTAVLAATELFEHLAERIRTTSVAELGTTRARVPNLRKALVVARAVRGGRDG